MASLAAEIQRALGPTYGPGGVAELLRDYHAANGVDNGAMHPFYAASVAGIAAGGAGVDLGRLMQAHFEAMP